MVNFKFMLSDEAITVAYVAIKAGFAQQVLKKLEGERHLRISALICKKLHGVLSL